MRAIGDNQLGNGEPMATPLIVYATRTWANRVEEVTRSEIALELEMHSDPFQDGAQPGQPEPHPPPAEDYGCLAVDSRNAYGSMLRSTMLRADRLWAPRLAGRQATQWSRPTTALMGLDGAYHHQPRWVGGRGPNS